MKKFLLFLLLCAGGGSWWYLQKNPPPNWLLPLIGPLKIGAAQAQTPAASTNPAASGRGPEGMPPVPVLTGIVETRDVPIHLNGLGNVQGSNTVTVRSRVDGQLEKVAFTEGQDVQAGDLLAQIDARPFQAALDLALARRKQNEALLANAHRDLNRDLALLAEKAGTQQKADTQKALVEQLEATLKADDAAIESAQVQLSYTTIRSPLSGRAGIRLVDEGNVVRATDAGGLVVVTQLKPVSVVFTLSEQHLPLIRAEAEKGALSVIALGRDNTSRLAEGVLSVIDNQIDATTGTIRLKATFPNEKLELWPGQFVNVRLRVQVRQGATVVPAQVVQQGPAGTFAFVVTPEGTAEVRPLKINKIEDGLALVDSGLQSGERVVVDGQYRLQPGAKVRPADGAGKGGSGSLGGSGKSSAEAGGAGKGTGPAPGEGRPRTAEAGNTKPTP